MADILNMSLIDALGVLGSLVIAGAYFAVSSGRISADRAPFHLINLAGAGMILLSLWFRPNPGAIVMEVLWSLIALGALWRIARGKSRS